MTTIEPRTAVVRIYFGDYLDRIRHLERRHEAAVKAEASAPRTLSDPSEAQALADQHAALVAEADQSSVDVTLKALGRKRWRDLVREHPPRPDVKDDEAAGVNEESFADALVPLSIVEPGLTVDDLDAVSDVDYQRLYVSAFALNRLPAADPKDLGWTQSQKSDATSN